MKKRVPIGVFDSGFGGLTVLRNMVDLMPDYDFLYLGDNARAPYGTRSFEVIYQYTLEAVKHLFAQGCPLVILACNTASARALRTIQQKDLPHFSPYNRVLGIIRPTAEVIGAFTLTGKVGILGTPGTVRSESYILEIKNQFPDLEVFQHACPMWVPIVENGLESTKGAQYFIEEDMKALFRKNSDIDAILLGCTHYPLLIEQIKDHLPKGVRLISQGNIVAKSLIDYLHRHPEMDARLSKNGNIRFLTTMASEGFETKANDFYGEEIIAKQVELV